MVGRKRATNDIESAFKKHKVSKMTIYDDGKKCLIGRSTAGLDFVDSCHIVLKSSIAVVLFLFILYLYMRAITHRPRSLCWE